MILLLFDSVVSLGPDHSLSSRPGALAVGRPVVDSDPPIVQGGRSPGAARSPDVLLGARPRPMWTRWPIPGVPGQAPLIGVAGCPVARSVDPQLLASATDRLSVDALGVADPVICGCAFGYVARQQVLRERDQAPQR